MNKMKNEEAIKMVKDQNTETLDKLFKVEVMKELIRKALGCKELELTHEWEIKDYGSMIGLNLKSNNLLPNFGDFGKHLFSEIVIETFGSATAYFAGMTYGYYSDRKKVTNEEMYASIHFGYKHPSGGSNGHGFASMWFENGSWTLSRDSDSKTFKKTSLH